MQNAQPAALVEPYYKLDFPDRTTFLVDYLTEARDDIHQVWDLLDIFSGDADLFTRAVRQVVAQDPDNLPANRILAWIWTRQGQFEQATETLTRIIRLAPEAAQVERRELLRVCFLEPRLLTPEVIETGRQGLDTPFSDASYTYQISRALGLPAMREHAEILRSQFRSAGDALRSTILAGSGPMSNPALAELLKAFDGARRIALIGNGPSLRGARRGQEINRYDLVVRCNFPMIANFAEDVGGRTDAVLFTEALFRLLSMYVDRDPSYKSAKLITIENAAAAGGLDPDAIARAVGVSVARVPTYAMDVMKDAVYRHLTTGALAYLLLASLFGKQITVFGFDFYSQKELHYFAQNTGLWLAHEVQYEKFLFQQVVKPVFGAYSR